MFAHSRLAMVFVTGGVILLAGHTIPAAFVPTAPAAYPLPAHALHGPSVISNYCGTCHTSGRARIDLDGEINSQIVRQDIDGWRRVLRMMGNGQMPPKRFPQPSDDERQHAIRWIEAELEAALAMQDSPHRLRRLTRQEYQNTICDLFGTDPSASEKLVARLPEDNRHWDIGTVPVIAPELLAKYEAAADGVLARLDIQRLLPVYVPGYLEAIAVFVGVESPAALDGEIARVFLGTFARQAYRRPVTPEELTTLTRICEKSWSGETGLQSGLRVALREIMTSPHFLYRMEERETSGNAGQINEFELASRLSFLLWNSGPDAELLNLAEQGQLRVHLGAQAKRMLKDDRVVRFARDFASEWLGLNYFASSTLDNELGQAMRQETETFVTSILTTRSSLIDLLDADYSFLNERLAKHYGIAGVTGDHFRKVATANTVRGGLLTQASFLALTCRSDQSEPVQRGKWVLDKILGTPPPPPPAGLLEAFETTRSKFDRGSAAQRLAQHRSDPSCAHCHSQMDALGLALENFDGLGAWRELPQATSPESSRPGDLVLHGHQDLKAHLLQKRDQFILALGSRLLHYALGQKSLPLPVLHDTLREPCFENLVLEVVHNEPFVTRFQ